MKTTLAHRYDDTMNDDKTIGSVVQDQICLCVAEDCPIETVLAMMSHMETRTAAVISKGNIFQGLVNRSSLLGSLIIQSDFDVGTPLDTSALKRLKAADVMITSSSFLTSELSLDDALEIMREHGYKTMPVLKENAQFVGIAEMDAVIEAQNDEANDALMSFLSSRQKALGSTAKH